MQLAADHGHNQMWIVEDGPIVDYGNVEYYLELFREYMELEKRR